MRLQFQIGRIEYDAARDITMIWPEDNFLYMGHTEIKGKISPEKCRNMFGEKVDGLFGKGYAMSNPRYIEITKLEEAGWFLCRQTRNQKNLSAMETKPLRCVPPVRLNADSEPQNGTQSEPQNDAEPKQFTFPPTFRDQDANGKPVCRRCGKRLGAAKTAFCANCGGQFVEEADE